MGVFHFWVKYPFKSDSPPRTSECCSASCAFIISYDETPTSGEICQETCFYLYSRLNRMGAFSIPGTLYV